MTKVPEPAKAEAKTIPTLKTSDTSTAKSIPAKVQEPMYTKAATPKIIKVFNKFNRGNSSFQEAHFVFRNDYAHLLSK